jgi:hypothetical protein
MPSSSLSMSSRRRCPNNKSSKGGLDAAILTGAVQKAVDAKSLKGVDVATQ